MTTNMATWMKDPRVQARKVGELVLPGSHDSGTYEFDGSLSTIEYPNIAFLWQLSPDQAPRGSEGGETKYIGPDAYSFVMDLVGDTAQATGHDTVMALAAGLRCLDLRIYWDETKGDVYAQHALRAAPLAEMLQGIASFLADPFGQELVLVEISHTNFAQHAEGVDRTLRLIEELIPVDAIHRPPSLNALAGEVLSTITDKRSKVVFVCTDDPPPHFPPGSSVITDAGWDSTSDPDGVDTVSALEAREQAGLDRRAQEKDPAQKLYSVSWTLTPQTDGVVREAMSRAAGNAPNQVLWELAKTANLALPAFVGKNVNPCVFQRVLVDWKTTSQVVEICIALCSGEPPPAAGA